MCNLVNIKRQLNIIIYNSVTALTLFRNKQHLLTDILKWRMRCTYLFNRAMDREPRIPHIYTEICAHCGARNICVHIYARNVHSIKLSLSVDVLIGYVRTCMHDAYGWSFSFVLSRRVATLIILMHSITFSLCWSKRANETYTNLMCLCGSR